LLRLCCYVPYWFPGGEQLKEYIVIQPFETLPWAPQATCLQVLALGLVDRSMFLDQQLPEVEMQGWKMSVDVEAAAAALASWALSLRRLCIEQQVHHDLGPRALRALSALSELEEAVVGGQRLLRRGPSKHFMSPDLLAMLEGEPAVSPV
jgi:hypothetical protein